MTNTLMSVSTMTSMQIAEVTGKRHADLMRDIRDEIEKLEAGGINGERKFALSSYITEQNKEMPCYILTKEGVLQLAARYDAVVRAKLIELATREDKPQTIEDLIIMQAQSMKELRGQVQQLTGTVGTIKDTIITQPDNWRDDLNRMFNRIVDKVGGKRFQELRSESYQLLEERAHVDLKRRLIFYQARLKEQGASKTAVEKANRLDIIEQDPKLREIYAKIIQEYTIRFVA